jgi:DNA polymerase
MLLDHLRARQARGETHVFLDEPAKEVLRTLFLRQKQGPPRPPPAAASAEPNAPSAAAEPVVREAEPPTPAPATVAATGDTADARIASLRAQAESWPAAKSLGTLRDKMVFSTGSSTAELMLVGEAPGHHEERRGEPFVGPAGQKLDAILGAMGLDREAIYLTNIVKFRPAMPRQTSNNRKPTPEEMAACLPFVREEVRVVRPKCLVALGATAAEGLLDLRGPVGKMRGRWHEFEGIPARVTYHPAYLLHGSAGLRDKRMIWEDMLEVMSRLGLAISEKQRGYFLPKS